MGMRAYTTISYNDLSLEELVKFGKKAPRYLQGRDNGLLYNGSTSKNYHADYKVHSLDGQEPTFYFKSVAEHHIINE